MRLIRTFAAYAMLALTAFSAPGHAQAPYPNRPITLVVPVSPGGSTDTGARIYAQGLSEVLGQPVVVVNRPGAGLTIGTGQVAKSAPDGYHLLFTINSPISIAKFSIAGVPYDPQKDLEPISLVAETLMAIVATPKFAPNTMAEVIAYAKANPGKVRFASPGVGTPDHLAIEIINDRAGVQMLHVPYQGGAPALADLRAGVVDLGVASLVSVQPHVQAGALKIIALLENKRSPKMAQVPIVDETVPEVGRPTWFGVFAPAGTPQALVQRLNAATLEVLRRPDVSERMNKAGLQPVGTSVDHLRQQVGKDLEYFGGVFKRLNLNLK